MKDIHNFLPYIDGRSLSPNDNHNQQPQLHLPCQSSHHNVLPSSSDPSNIKQNVTKERKSKREDFNASMQGLNVRAKRGHATDSHSIAERMRRQKINQKLRCLQELVPGCYKTMGMAVMLDVVINYVRSLQNQIEFLSIKLLAAASSHESFNLEERSFNIMQGTQSFSESHIEDYGRSDATYL